MSFDLKATSKMLIGFFFVATFSRMLLGVTVPLGIIVLCLIWFFLYFLVWRRLLNRIKSIGDVYNFYLFFNIIDLLIITGVVHFTGGASWIGVVFYPFTLTVAGLILPKKKVTILVLLAIFLFSALVLLEGFGIISHRPMFEMGPGLYRSPVFMATQILIIGPAFYFLVDSAGEHFRILKKKNEDLNKEREKVLVAYKKAKEAERVLEVRVRARTRELERLSVHQEEIIRERTKKLEEKIEESERFRKLVVGRELRMIELKKGIIDLNKLLKKRKK